MAKKRRLNGKDLAEQIHEVWCLAQDLEEFSAALIDERVDEIADSLRLASDLSSAIHTFSMLSLRIISHERRLRDRAELEKRLEEAKARGVNAD